MPLASSPSTNGGFTACSPVLNFLFNQDSRCCLVLRCKSEGHGRRPPTKTSKEVRSHFGSQAAQAQATPKLKLGPHLSASKSHLSLQHVLQRHGAWQERPHGRRSTAAGIPAEQHRRQLGSSWVPAGFQLGSSWVPAGFQRVPAGFQRGSNGFQLGSSGFQLGSSWVPAGSS